MPLPATVPVALTPEFATLKATTWAVFIRRNALAPVEMAAALDTIRDFVLPVLRAAAAETPFTQIWEPGKGWR